MTTIAFSLSLFICLLAYGCNGSIDDKVAYHEVISSNSVLIRHRRSANMKKEGATDFIGKDFTFTAFNRTFNCHLRPRPNFFSPSFKLKVYGADGIPREHKFRRDNILVGSCDGDPESEIRGYFKDGVFTGSVLYDGKMYGLEDATRHITIPKSKDSESHGHMIVYRTSDMKWDKEQKQNGHGPSFCGDVHADDVHVERLNMTGEIVVDSVVPAPERGRRHKRATVPSWNTCRMVAVADYTFFRNTGRNDIYDTALYISGVMDVVDNIYRQTFFNVGYSVTGLGFEIEEMRVYEAPTAGFNSEGISWRPISFLEAFSEDSTLSEFCVAHLFTHQSFTGNVLGLAYIAPPWAGGVGGICSPSEDAEVSLNTGWSSTKNGNQETILMQQSNLVTAHELGHNWGAEHDPESGGCAPSGLFDDGKYLMYPYSVSGYDSNNYKLSSCSRTYISKVITAKGPYCFKAETYDENIVCGNGRVDVNAGEACDAGFIGRFNLDKCCDNQCQFVPGATCSPVNSECCTNCQVASAGTVCRGETGVDCQETAYCDGVELTCPRSENKTNGTACLDEGQCQDGVCLPYCDYRGLVDCACEKLEESCFRCCRESRGAECMPHNKSRILPDGRPCVGGFCELGQCTASSVSSIQRLFDILQNINVDNIVEFFRNNIVGTVIVFSLFLWIPCSVIISYLDHRKRNRLDRSDNIEVRMNRTLLHDEDKRKVEVIRSPGDPTRGTTSPRYRNANFTDLGGFGSASDA